MKKRLNGLAINNLTLIIIIGQIVVYLAMNAGLITHGMLALNYGDILNGQVWRVISFLLIPPTTSPVWAMVSWYILFLMGSNLENYWGELHYTIYILVAVVLNNLVAYIFNLYIATNYYLQSSIFLAFAFLNPNFQVRLFFILPIKIKWIAIINWVLYTWVLLTGGLGERLLIVASLANFIIFFGKDLFFKIRYRGKSVKSKIEMKVAEKTPSHTCVICSRNNLTNPHLEFRYCSKCTPEQCYCEEHVEGHIHKS